MNFNKQNIYISNITQNITEMHSQAKSFSLTGFDDVTEETYVTQLINLGCTYIKNLSELTQVLIVNSTITEKFKIARLNKSIIPCVVKKWVEDSAKQNYLQPLEKYTITQKQMFLGVCVAVCGFQQEKFKKIEKIIKEKGGSAINKYQAADIIRNYQNFSQKIDVIIATQKQIQRAKHAKLPNEDDHIVPLVRLQWLDHSLSRKRCKFPKDYAVNLMWQKPITSTRYKLQKRLKAFLQTYDIMDIKSEYLQDTMIYIDSDFPADFGRLLKNLIAICGGYWTDKFTSVVTHVLVLQIDENKFREFKKYGSRIHIVRSEWLVDSILLYNRMEEEDYLVRSFKVSDQLFRVLTQENLARNNQNSFNFNSMPVLLGDRKLTASSNTLPIQAPLMQKKKSTIQQKTQIFKNRKFYFPPQVINDQYYSDLIRTIRLAGGETYDKINSRMNVYVPLKDSLVVKKIQDNLIVSKLKALVISDRWVKECIKKNTFIVPDLKVYIHYKAFEFITPLSDFHKYIFEVVGFESEIIPRIRDLLSVFGSTKTNPNKSQVTHILCGPYWTDSISEQKINKIQTELQRMNKRKNYNNEDKRIFLIKYEWLDRCREEKKTVPHDDFILKTLRAGGEFSTPEKKSQEMSLGSQQKHTEVENNQSETKLTP